MSEEDHVAEMVLRLLQNIEAKLKASETDKRPVEQDRVIAYCPPQLRYRKRAS